MTSNTFGFGGVKKPASKPADMDDINKRIEEAAKLAPQPVEDDPEEDRSLRRAAENRGDTIRQSPVEVAKKVQPKGPTKQLSTRMSIQPYNRFVLLSQYLRCPYDRAIEALMDAAGIGEDGIPTKPLRLD